MSHFNGNPGWSLGDELSFIASLGRARSEICEALSGPKARMSRAELLEGYLVGLDRRRVWAGLDEHALRVAATMALAEERKRS